MVQITSYLPVNLLPSCHPKMLTHIYFSMIFNDASMELIEDVDNSLIYQEERVYDDEEEEDWWNKFCVPDEEPEWLLIRVGLHNIHSRWCRR